MICVNNREFQWQEGLTVKKILEMKKYTYPRVVVIINKDIIQPEDYSSTVVKDGDDVQVVHLMAGG